MEIIGKIKEITPIETLQTRAGGTFEKRNVILDCSRTDEWTGDVYTNVLCFEVAPSKVHDYDNMSSFVGQPVTVRFAMNGRETVNQLGEKRYFTTLRCLGVAPVQRTQQAVQQPVQRPVQQVQQMPSQVQQPVQPQQISFGGNTQLPF